jgi:hypothetical protein
MAVRTATPSSLHAGLTTPAPNVAIEQRKLVPIKWWAGLGALIVAFILYVLSDWIAGPYFKRVPAGPSDVPAHMEIAGFLFQVLSWPVALGMIYWFAVRPWRGERTLTLDGMLVIAFATLWFQDPLSAYGGHRFVYNANLINFGSWVHSVPGWQSFGQPGEMVVEPIAMIGGTYVYAFVLVMTLGTAVMRRAQARWPQMGKAGLIGCTFVAMCLFDIVFEGIIFMPLGIWEYPGGHLSIFPSTYHAYPLHEMLTTGALFTGVAALRYFRNDRGETVVERGAERIGSPRRRTLARLFAIIAAVHVVMFVSYNMPNYLVGTHSNDWPADLQKRSYFTNGICGERTDRACPSAATPLVRNDNSGEGGGSTYLTRDGRLGLPEGARVPEPIPFDRGR